MRLTPQQIRSIATGFLDARTEDGHVRLLRITDAQSAVYREDAVSLKRARSAAGITLNFYTDSQSLTLACSDIILHPNYHCAFDIFVNKQFYDSFSLTVNGSEADPKPVGFQHTFRLPQGEKQVTLYFPLYSLQIDTVALDDGAAWSACQSRLAWIAFGDSITEGREPDHPGNTYVSRLARMLDATVYNQGISGEMFRSRKILPGSYPACDFVTVAYGTNDFRKQPPELLIPEMSAFLKQVTREFPNVPIFCLLPLWRKDHETVTRQRTLTQVREILRQEAGKYPRIHIIDCWDFIPHDESLFYDRRLHPNDAGFACYADALYPRIRKILSEV